MGYSQNNKLEKVYAARTDIERREAYNDWSEDYDRDVSKFGIQLPGLIIWSTHGHINSQTQPYHNHRKRLTDAKKWTLEFETDPFVSMPDGDQNIKHAVYVYRVI